MGMPSSLHHGHHEAGRKGGATSPSERACPFRHYLLCLPLPFYLISRGNPTLVNITLQGHGIAFERVLIRRVSHLGLRRLGWQFARAGSLQDQEDTFVPREAADDEVPAPAAWLSAWLFTKQASETVHI